MYVCTHIYIYIHFLFEREICADLDIVMQIYIDVCGFIDSYRSIQIYVDSYRLTLSKAGNTPFRTLSRAKQS